MVPDTCYLPPPSAWWEVEQTTAERGFGYHLYSSTQERKRSKCVYACMCLCALESFTQVKAWWKAEVKTERCERAWICVNMRHKFLRVKETSGQALHGGTIWSFLLQHNKWLWRQMYASAWVPLKEWFFTFTQHRWSFISLGWFILPPLTSNPSKPFSHPLRLHDNHQSLPSYLQSAALYCLNSDFINPASQRPFQWNYFRLGLGEQ